MHRLSNSDQLIFNAFERAAASHLPPSIRSDEAFDTYLELTQTVYELTMLAQMDADLAKSEHGLSYFENARLLGGTATQLFSHALTNWPETPERV